MEGRRIASKDGKSVTELIRYVEQCNLHDRYSVAEILTTPKCDLRVRYRDLHKWVICGEYFQTHQLPPVAENETLEVIHLVHGVASHFVCPVTWIEERSMFLAQLNIALKFMDRYFNAWSRSRVDVIPQNNAVHAALHDGEWFRVRVLSIDNSEYRAKAFSLDFGWTTYIEFSRFRSLPIDFLVIRPLCVEIFFSASIAQGLQMGDKMSIKILEKDHSGKFRANLISRAKQSSASESCVSGKANGRNSSNEAKRWSKEGKRNKDHPPNGDTTYEKQNSICSKQPPSVNNNFIRESAFKNDHGGVGDREGTRWSEGRVDRHQNAPRNSNPNNVARPARTKETDERFHNKETARQSNRGGWPNKTKEHYKENAHHNAQRNSDSNRCGRPTTTNKTEDLLNSKETAHHNAPRHSDSNPGGRPTTTNKTEELLNSKETAHHSAPQHSDSNHGGRPTTTNKAEETVSPKENVNPIRERPSRQRGRKKAGPDGLPHPNSEGLIEPISPRPSESVPGEPRTQVRYHCPLPLNEVSTVLVVYSGEEGTFAVNEPDLQNFTRIQKALGEFRDDCLSRTVPSINKLCLAPFFDDLYRARVVAADSGKFMCRVLFVDYGNEEDVKMSDVRDLPKEVSREIYTFKISSEGDPIKADQGTVLHVIALSAANDGTVIVQVQDR